MYRCRAWALILLGAFLLLPAAGQRQDSPNYALAARFMPAAMNQLLFDTVVTPHWFSHSDRFWYSYSTSVGVDYYLVDPAQRTQKLLWDNHDLARQLSLLTDLPYDAQHLDLQGVALVENDTALQFSVKVRKDARLPDDSGSQEASLQAANQTAATRDVYFQVDLATGKLRRLDGFQPPKRATWAAVSPDQQTVLFARGENLYMMDAANYAKALANPADPGIVETQLTTDGVAKYSYSRSLLPEALDAMRRQDRRDADDPRGMRRPAIGIQWSQDGKKFSLVRQDDRKVADLWTIHSLTSPRPELEASSYAMPGEQNVPIPEVQIFTLTDHSRIVIPQNQLPLVDPTIAIVPAPRGEAPAGGGSRWLAPGSDKLYFISTGRDFRDIDIGVIDTASGAVKTLIQETSNVWLDEGPNADFGRRQNLWLVDHGQHLIWWSERDGWGHFYLYDAATGKLVNQITAGAFMSDKIVALDDAARTMYFLGERRDPGSAEPAWGAGTSMPVRAEAGRAAHRPGAGTAGAGQPRRGPRQEKMNPYYSQLYRIQYDGTGLTSLTHGDFNYAVETPNGAEQGKTFVLNYSRVNTAPVSELIDGQGTELAKLQTADVSRLMAAGFQYPEPFKIKAADGITDIYGVMYKPFDFDPHKKYPIIESVYPGPQTESVAISFSADESNYSYGQNIPLAQLGFIVVELGNRGGSPLRDKWYDSYGYGNLRDYGLADKREAVLELAERYPFIDASRAGIWGFSGGGFMAAAAMMQYPGFYQAGWSESANNENDIYNRAWSEKYDGVRQQRQADGTIRFLYDIEKNSELAANLRGHLMLTTSDMDDNVSMASTMRLANALIHANKRFQMMIYPGTSHPHTDIQDYVLVNRMDFFARWLLGASDTGADILLLQNQSLHTPGRKFIE